MQYLKYLIYRSATEHHYAVCPCCDIFRRHGTLRADTCILAIGHLLSRRKYVGLASIATAYDLDFSLQQCGFHLVFLAIGCDIELCAERSH